MYLVHTDPTIARVRDARAAGVSISEISRQTGVARQTIRRWCQREFDQLSATPLAWVPGKDYSYVLGLYLGDGSLSLPGRSRTHTLNIACDATYRVIIAEAVRAMQRAFPHAAVRYFSARDAQCVHLRLTHPALCSAFPQHGPGRKHERTIELTQWQRVVTERHAAAFIRGLIHSDGSRCVNQVNTILPSGRKAHYEYVRYFFTNYSADIRRIFCEHCELLGIRWTQSNARNISISHRDSVAILERIVGPKT